MKDHSFLNSVTAAYICRLFNFKPSTFFIFRGEMIKRQYIMMFVITAIFCVTGAVMLRTLERTVPDTVLDNIFHCIWLLSVTQITIGYGDLVAETQLGRGVTMFLAFFSIVITSFVVKAIKESS
jgi:hypothetical protein